MRPILFLPLLLAAPAPIAAAPAPASIQNLRDACMGRDGWSEPAPPLRVFGNVWYVGTCGIAALLITSPTGHVVIDGGPAGAGRLVAANIVRAGFRLRDVRWILSSHEHNDHAGGIAELKRLTGARVAARAPGAAVVRTGNPDANDPQAGSLKTFAPVTVDRIVHDHEVLRLGALALTAQATPGHSPGPTSWTWQSCEGRARNRECHHFAYADSVSAISADGYRFSDHPGYVARFRQALARIGSFDCENIITPHPGASNLFERLAGSAPLADPQARADYAAKGSAALDARLASETGAHP